MKTFTARYLDSGFYVVSDAAAGALVRVLGQKLPKAGWEKFVMLDCPHGPINAWLQRADVRHSMRHKSKRGWVWAIYGVRKDAGEYLPALGDSFQFNPIGSTTARVNPLFTLPVS